MLPYHRASKAFQFVLLGATIILLSNFIEELPFHIGSYAKSPTNDAPPTGAFYTLLCEHLGVGCASKWESPLQNDERWFRPQLSAVDGFSDCLAALHDIRSQENNVSELNSLKKLAQQWEEGVVDVQSLSTCVHDATLSWKNAVREADQARETGIVTMRMLFAEFRKSYPIRERSRDYPALKEEIDLLDDLVESKLGVMSVQVIRALHHFTEAQEALSRLSGLLHPETPRMKKPNHGRHPWWRVV